MLIKLFKRPKQKGYKQILKLFTIVFIATTLQSCSKCVVDIYYSPGTDEKYKAALEGHYSHCYYTLNECKENCTTLHIQRKDYDKWAKEYTSIGLEPPHPKRTDTDKFVKPPK